MLPLFMIPSAIIAPEVAGEATAIAILPWTLLIPIIINAAMLAYMFGALNQRIKVLETDLAKLENANDRVSDRLHTLSSMLVEVRTILTTINDPANYCSLARGTRKRASKVMTEQDT